MRLVDLEIEIDQSLRYTREACAFGRPIKLNSQRGTDSGLGRPIIRVGPGSRKIDQSSAIDGSRSVAGAACSWVRSSNRFIPNQNSQRDTYGTELEMIDQWGELNASQCGAPRSTRNDRPIIRASVAAGNGCSRSGVGAGVLLRRSTNRFRRIVASLKGAQAGGKHQDRPITGALKYIARPIGSIERGTPRPTFEFDWPFMLLLLLLRRKQTASCLVCFCCLFFLLYCVSCRGCVCISWRCVTVWCAVLLLYCVFWLVPPSSIVRSIIDRH